MIVWNQLGYRSLLPKGASQDTEIMSAMTTKSYVLSIVYCKIALIHLTIEGLGINPNLFAAFRIFEREIGLAFICGAVSNVNVSLEV